MAYVCFYSYRLWKIISIGQPSKPYGTVLLPLPNELDHCALHHICTIISFKFIGVLPLHKACCTYHLYSKDFASANRLKFWIRDRQVWSIWPQAKLYNFMLSVSFGFLKIYFCWNHAQQIFLPFLHFHMYRLRRQYKYKSLKQPDLQRFYL